jgi:hypothetical protein
MSCCIDSSVFSHDSDSLAEALGVSEEERLKATKLVDEALKLRKVSEMVELIWSKRCDDLSVQAKVYATLKLGMDIYRIILESMLVERGGAPVEGGEGSS